MVPAMITTNARTPAMMRTIGFLDLAGASSPAAAAAAAAGAAVVLAMEHLYGLVQFHSCLAVLLCQYV
jgi:hypothetical protein